MKRTISAIVCTMARVILSMMPRMLDWFISIPMEQQNCVRTLKKQTALTLALAFGPLAGIMFAAAVSGTKSLTSTSNSSARRRIKGRFGAHFPLHYLDVLRLNFLEFIIDKIKSM